jgi:hypothetical protein
MTGPARPRGRNARVLVAGRPGWFNRYISQLVFLSPPSIETVAAVPIWKLRGRLRDLRDTVDLTIALADSSNAAWLFADGYLVVPTWVGMRRPAPDCAEEMELGRRSRRREIQRIRHHAYRPFYSRAPGDLADFYHGYHVPMCHSRHGEDAFVQSERFYRQVHARGGILWIRKGEERVAGALLEPVDGVLQSWAFGMRGGDEALMKQGVMAAVYLYACLQARVLGCHSIDFRASRPFLSDGVLRYKQKWGGILYERSTMMYEDMAIAWPRWGQVLSDVLGELSVIFRDQGRLSALSSLDTSEPASSQVAAQRCHQLWVPGLHRLYLVSGCGWQPGAQPPPGCQLLRPEQVETPAVFCEKTRR